MNTYRSRQAGRDTKNYQNYQAKNFKTEQVTQESPQGSSPVNSNHNSSFFIKKHEFQSFPKIIRVSTQVNKSNQEIGASFTKQSRNKQIRNIYTPSQKDKLNESVRKLYSQTSRQHTRSSNISSNQTQIHSRQPSAKAQVKAINNTSNNKSKTDQTQSTFQDTTAVEASSTSPGLRNLSKLVNYSLYKNHPQSNRQVFFDANRRPSFTGATRNSMQQLAHKKTSTHNQPYLNKSSNDETPQSRPFNQPPYAQSPQLVQISGNHMNLQYKKNSPFQSKIQPRNFSQKAIPTGDEQQQQSIHRITTKPFLYRNERVQVKDSKIFREKDMPRYAFFKKLEKPYYHEDKLKQETK